MKAAPTDRRTALKLGAAGALATPADRGAAKVGRPPTRIIRAFLARTLSA